MSSRSKLPPVSSLNEARALLEEAKKTFVPSHTTSDAWIAEYVAFCEGTTSNEKWNDFVALLLYRTTIPAGSPGHLHITSAYTYMKYILKDRRFYKHTFSDATKALETKSSKVGPIRKAPTLGEEHAANVLQYIHSGDPAELKLRSGLWCQVVTGGRRVDVSRLGLNCMNWGEEIIESVHWRWTKSIRKAGDSKLCPSLEEVREMAGPPPFTLEEWTQWCHNSKDGCGFEDYSNASANQKLAELSVGFSERATTTSLRDIFHRVLAKVCDRDSSAMVRFTQHRTGKTLQSVYQEKRKISVPTSTKRSSKKRKAPIAKNRKQRSR